MEDVLRVGCRHTERACAGSRQSDHKPFYVLRFVWGMFKGSVGMDSSIGGTWTHSAALPEAPVALV